MLSRLFLFVASLTTLVAAQTSFTFLDAYQTAQAGGSNAGPAVAIANYIETTGTSWSTQYYVAAGEYWRNWRPIPHCRKWAAPSQVRLTIVLHAVLMPEESQ
jgi:hypothetical protein